MTIYNCFWNKSITPFYNRVIELLKLSDEYDVVYISKLHPYNGPDAVDPWPKLKEELVLKGRPVILFLADDEYYTSGDEYIIPGITKKIFKHYVYFDYKDHPTIRPIPLPAVAKPKQLLTFDNRVYDYSFMGVNNPYRNKLKLALEARNDNNLKFTYFFNESHGHLLPFYKQYSNILINSKVSLCPLGWRCNECYRTIESARFGCIILTSELLPHWYNQTSPYFKVDDWSDLSVLDEVLSKSNKELRDLSYLSRKWYEDYLSPEAVAEFITQELN